MSTGIYVSSGTLYQYDDGGTPNWTKPTLFYSCVDGNANVYAASGGTVKKYDPAGNEQWSRTYHTTTILGLAADNDGSVYICGNRDASITHAKYDSSGSLVWSKDHGGTLNCVTLDSDGNSYFGGLVISSVSIRSYEPDGTPRWNGNHGATVNGICAFGNTYIYIAGEGASGPVTHRQFSTDGTPGWTADHGLTMRGCCVDSSGNAFFGGNRWIGVTTRKHNESGTLQWARDYNGTTVFAVAADNDGNLYAGGATATYSLRKYNDSGTEQWGKAIGTCRHIWYFITPTVTDVPALPIPLALGVPGSGFFHIAPALAIDLELGIPTIPDLTSPDPLALPGQTFYRALVSGPGDPLEVPLASIQCRRRRGDSTWLTIWVPFYSENLKTELMTRLSAWAELLIFSGIREQDGSETIGQFLRAVLTEVRPEREANRSGFTLVSRVVPTSYTLGSRTLYGVQERGKDRRGLRTARCGMIDPLLRPGDTVDDGVQSWIAGAILYLISPSVSYMDVSEDS